VEFINEGTCWSILTLFISFFVGIVTSAVSSLIGGGGVVIAVPALNFLGLPLNVAIATTRFGCIGQSGSSAYKFGKSNKISKPHVFKLIIISVVGSYFGSKILIDIDEHLLSKVVAVIFLAILPVTWISRKFGVNRVKETKTRTFAGFFIYIALSIYDGFFGAGGGILAVYIFIYFFGLKYVEANATGQVPWFFNNIISTIIFMTHNIIDFSLGIPFLLGSILGGYIGAHGAVEKGDRFAKLAVSIFVLISSLILLF